ncbi:MAG: molybdopterin molybdenumtransferase MoeA [Herbaspirillum sp.]|jgi:molybdopterin molybdotransferase|nr:molybdopterin molybdenumtransferase MoeA [Herbaspirillum sp.]
MKPISHTSPASLQDIVSCLSDYDPNALTVAQGQQVIGQFVQAVKATEYVAIRSALNRVLAGDIHSTINVPAHDNSAMDGYAFHSDELNGAADQLRLRIVGSIQAGSLFDGAVGRGECVRIMTGAAMPTGCDTVVPQEFTQTDDHNAEYVTLLADCVAPGANRRLAGEDLSVGQIALQGGKILRPADLGLLASLGIPEVSVRRRLRVAFFSTGDELRSVGQALDPGCVYDSNRYTLYGMLTRLGCDVIDMGVVNDHPAALEAALRSGCENADAVITSGGVSVGVADYTKQSMAALGEVLFWKIGMRPGRPMAFGSLLSNGKRALLFGLPGNPVAVMVSFYFFVRSALLQMSGATQPALPMLRVKSESSIRKRPGRTEYQRGIVAPGADGVWSVRLTGEQGSGILRSMSDANCIIVLGHEQDNVVAGDTVEVVLFEGLI